VNAVTAKFLVKKAWLTARFAVTELSTVSENVAVAVALFASVTVTVYVVALLVAVAVPVIAPVAELRFNPVGRLGDTL
jgi:hypothetical protein